MFAKCFFQNIKHHPLRYITIVVCEIVMIILSMIANGIFLDSLAEYNGAKLWSRYFKFAFDPICSSEIREKIYDFNQKCPVELSEMIIGVISPEETNYTCYIRFFPTYEDMVNFFEQNNFNFAKGSFPTREQFENHDPVCVAGNAPSGDSYIYTDDGEHIIYGNKEYLVSGTLDSNAAFFLFLGSEPDNVKVKYINFVSKSYPDEELSKEIENLFLDVVCDNMTNLRVVSTPEQNGLLDTKKSLANIVLTALIQLIAIFNVMLIFRYIVDSRKKEYAVYRLCGFPKSTCLLNSLCEIMVISFICALSAFVIFEIIKPSLSTRFAIISPSFDFSYYTVLLLGYLAATALLFAVYVAPSLKKSVAKELREV